MMNTLGHTANYWIDKLQLKEHPEGGYYNEVYRSEKIINLPEYKGPRNACTLIYYLLKGSQYSSFHKINSDEIWHFYAGSSLSLYILNSNLKVIKLGKNMDKGEIFHIVIKSNSWFAASVDDPASYCLVGCVVSPGFDYHDWEIGDKDILCEKYPQHKSIIMKLSK
ncbi:MAG TPA: cupin domain-containing protein [Verrucomicrobiae bacterium]|nr:cupin domain-containing protein [Verrucomicrobiae bacterium]